MTSSPTRPAAHPRLWLALFAAWFAVLWILSSRSGDMRDMPEILFLDKVIHFGYFLGGGVLLSAFLFTRAFPRPPWKRISLIAFAVLALIGAIDEYHQSFTPGRSGNDPFDWLADLCGAVAGTFVCRQGRRFLD